MEICDGDPRPGERILLTFWEACGGSPGRRRFAERDGGMHRFAQVRLSGAGLYRVLAQDAALGLERVMNFLFDVLQYGHVEQKGVSE